jgi:tetratricopeptide (TPR) repeat protein
MTPPTPPARAEFSPPPVDAAEAFQHGFRCHQAGNWQRASRFYQACLERDPNYAPALHLLGVLAIQHGQPRQAIDLIARAIALEPSAAPFHANLAEAYRLVGQLDRAAACCRTALRLEPNYPEALTTHGVILLARGQAADAAERFRAAIALRPNFALAHANLGNALRLSDQISEALDAFRRAALLEPSLALAHSNLGQLLLEQNQLPEALVHCREAVRLQPGFAEGQCNLGNVLRELGKLTEAKACYAEALRLNPDLAMVHGNMGQALQEEGTLDDALHWYHLALQLEPRNARFHTHLANALAEQERFDEASARYRQALRLDPCHAEAHNGLGWIAHELGRHEEARAAYEQALRYKPSLAVAHCNLAMMREEIGDFAAAKTGLRQALACAPNNLAALAQLATLERGKLAEEDRAALEQWLADPHLAEGKRCMIHFALAQVADAQKDFAAAGRHLAEANLLDLALRRKRGLGYEPAQHARFVDGMLAACTPSWFAGLTEGGSDSQRPIFIFGLPRSGTTLVEQILASHSQVHGAGELRLSRADFELLMGPGKDEKRGLAALERLDPAGARSLAARHLAALDRLQAEAPRIADKMPDNYLYLGLLAVLFPRAVFIHCRRDWRDIAVSCWITHFQHIPWANDVEHIATRFHEYQRLMTHWRRVLPVPLVEVDYEQVVGDLEGEARRLVSACGLAWEPGCLAFHETRRPVRTASASQVRQPIYKHSVARWKNYEAALGTLFERLGALPKWQDREQARSEL